MNVAAISAIARVAEPYLARTPALDDSRTAWETERAAQAYAARQAQRSAQTQAALEADRIERKRIAKAAFFEHAASRGPHHDSAAGTPPALVATLLSVDELRNEYADSRMRRAVQDYIVRPDPVTQRAGSANDLGTIEGLTPLQPYRVAMANPQVQELQVAVAIKAAALGVPKVANIGATENVTDNARYRAGRTL